MDDNFKIENEIDNSKLEQIMKKEITPQMQKKFFEVFKQSALMMPVNFGEGMFEGIENAGIGDVLEMTESAGFDIKYLTNADGDRAVPLFTSDEAMEESGLISSVLVLHMADLADMLKQSEKYSTVVVNPMTSSEINIPMEGFLSLFVELSDDEKQLLDSIDDLLEIIQNHSVELEENSTLILRLDENLMVENAVEDIFTAQVPFYVSSNPKYREDLKYTNILLMPKGKKILPVGPVENELDVVIAPASQFHLEDRLDEFTSLWMCRDQPFYDE